MFLLKDGALAVVSDGQTTAFVTTRLGGEIDYSHVIMYHNGSKRIMEY